MGLTLEQEALAFHLGFDSVVLEIVKDVVGDDVPDERRVPAARCYQPAWPFMRALFSHGEQLNCLSYWAALPPVVSDAVDPGPSPRQALVHRLRPALLEKGYFGYLSGNWVHVIQGMDPYQALRVEQTQGWGFTHHVSTQDVVALLQQWEQQPQWSLLEADTSFVKIELLTVPRNMLRLAGDIHRLCPEVGDQIYQLWKIEGSAELDEHEWDCLNVAHIAKVIGASMRVTLWWD